MVRTSPSLRANALTTAKFRCLLTLLLLCSILLCSCQTNTAGLASLHSITGDTWETSPDAYEHDYVIIPTHADHTLVARAKEFTAMLSEQTEIPATLYFDDEEILVRDRTRLILLGNTSHLLSQTHLRGRRLDDYLCVLDEGTLILGGKSDTATIAAIDRFCETLLPYADAEVLMNADQQFVYQAEYDVSDITLNGFALEDYRLVYPKDGQRGEEAIARALRDRIADRCGIYLDILCDDLLHERARVIEIGVCFHSSPPTQSAVYAQGSIVTLSGASEYELCDAAEKFYALLFSEDAVDDESHDNSPPESSEESGDVNVTLTEPIPVTTTTSTLLALIGLMTERTPTDDMVEIARLANVIQSATPMIVPFHSMSSSTCRYFDLSLTDYGYASLTFNEQTVLPFFYRKQSVTLLAQSEPEEGVHCLRFSLRETGMTFTVYHAIADTVDSANAILRAIEQSLPDSEPTIVFLATPTSVSPFDLTHPTLRDPLISDASAKRMQMLVHLPSAFVGTEILRPTTVDEPYTFRFSHSFWEG